MGEPRDRERAQQARGYLDMLGIGRRARRRPVVDVEIGDAQVETPSVEDRTLEAMAAARPDRARADDSTTRRAEIALAMADESIPEEWVQSGRAESQEGATARSEAQRARAAAEAEQRRRYAETRSRAYDRGILEGLSVDNRVQALGEGTMQGLTLGFGDELQGAASSAVHGGTYRGHRDEARARQDTAREGTTVEGDWIDPSTAYAGGEVLGSTPYSMLISSAGPGASLTRRVLTGGGTGAGFGGVTGAGHSEHDYDTPEFRGDVYRDAAIGGLAGAGTELAFAGARGLRNRFRSAPEGTPAPGRDFTPEQQAQIRAARDTDPDTWAMAREREMAEDAAAQRRVRSTADSAALSDVRRAGDYNGPGGEGYRGLARDLDETGIAPRRSMGSAQDAQLRAARVQEDAGEQLGGVRRRMAASTITPENIRLDDSMIVNTPDDLARIEAETQARDVARREAERAARAAEPDATGRVGQARQRPVTPARPSAASRMEWEAGDGSAPTEADALQVRRDIIMRRVAEGDIVDPARVRYDEAGRTIRGEADRLSREAITPAQHAGSANMGQIADNFSARAPETFDEAYSTLRGLDREAAYGRVYPNAPDAGPRVEQARAGRRVVREAMDDSVGNTLGEDTLAEYRRQRGRYGAARATGVLGERGAQREAANLQAGLTDSMGITAGLSSAGTPTQKVWQAVANVVVNRYIRGRGHAMAATLGEMHSDTLSREIVRRLAANQATTPASRALAEAARRSPRAFGVALMTMARDNPDVQREAAAAAQDVGALGDIDPDDVTGGFGGPTPAGAAPNPEPMRLEDIDPDDPAGGF